jgi:hypothetical protein
MRVHRGIEENRDGGIDSTEMRDRDGWRWEENLQHRQFQEV